MKKKWYVLIIFIYVFTFNLSKLNVFIYFVCKLKKHRLFNVYFGSQKCLKKSINKDTLFTNLNCYLKTLKKS